MMSLGDPWARTITHGLSLSNCSHVPKIGLHILARYLKLDLAQTFVSIQSWDLLETFFNLSNSLV